MDIHVLGGLVTPHIDQMMFRRCHIIDIGYMETETFKT